MVYRRSANRGASTRGARGPLEQKLEFATVDPVALHDEADQGILHQLGQRAPSDVHNISPRLSNGPHEPIHISTGTHRPVAPLECAAIINTALKREKALGDSSYLSAN
jgi:hypothetical protein